MTPTLERMWKMRHAYLFIAPFYFLFLVFGAFPLVWSFLLTFQEWDGLKPMKPAGLGNYALLLRDQRFLDAFVNTVIYWTVDVAFIMTLALVMASLLHNPWLKGRRYWRLDPLPPQRDRHRGRGPRLQHGLRLQQRPRQRHPAVRRAAPPAVAQQHPSSPRSP